MPKQVVVQIKTKLTWLVARDPDSGMYVGFCEAMSLNALGETFVEFQEAANEALSLLLDDLFESGELEAFLRRKGWETAQPLPVADGTPTFDVPFDLQNVARLPARAFASA